MADVMPEGNFVWNFHAFHTWLGNARELILIIMVLIHITSGQPACGEELTAITIRSTAKGDEKVLVLVSRAHHAHPILL